MRQAWCSLALCALVALCALPALALPPDQVFERAAPAVWALRLLGPDNQPSDVGTALAIAPGKAVTTCTQLPSGGKLVLQREKTTLAAKPEYADSARNLCQLDVPGLQAPEVPRAPARMGQRVYAIGYERGAEMTIIEGLVSRVREAGTDAERIQTSVPTSGWLMGAGLYDDEARLLGIVDASSRDAAGVVFAAPARWIAEIAGRGRVAASTSGGSAGGILPGAGASWTYSYAFRGLGSARFNIRVRATSVDKGLVREAISIASAAELPAAVTADSLGFRSFPLPRSQTFVEFAPYLHAALAGKEGIPWGKVAGYPTGNAAMPFWTLVANNRGEEQVTVPAGSFTATRIEVLGRRQAPSGFVTHLAHEATRFVYRAWYAPEVRRYVKLQHETWGLRGEWSGEQLVELLSYSEK